MERVLDGLLTTFKILTPFLVSLGLALHALSMQHILAAHMAKLRPLTSTQLSTWKSTAPVGCLCV